MQPNRGMVQKPYLLMIGGGKIPSSVVEAMTFLAGGEGAQAAVIPAANSSKGDSKYEDVLRAGGLDPVTVPLHTREDASDSRVLTVLQTAEVIFFAGGNQLRLVAALLDTPAEEVLLDRLSKGIILAGTSAGAAAMGEIMPAGGTGIGALHRGHRESNFDEIALESPRNQAEDEDEQKQVVIASGLGFLQGVIVDQHFFARARFGRLAYVTTRYRERRMMGLGIGESTACLVDWTSELLTVLGDGCVAALTAERYAYDNIGGSMKHQSPLATFGLSLNILSAGHGYNLRKRQPLSPDDMQPLVAATTQPQ